jgi:hypothetical protein
MQTRRMTIYSKASRSPSPVWIPSQGCTRKGQASGRVTLWIAHRISPHPSGSLFDLSRTTSRHLHYRASCVIAAGLIRSGTPMVATPQTQLV